jgi:hypothetical protein
MVQRTELYMECPLDAMFGDVLDEKLIETMPEKEIKRFRRGKFVSSYAVFDVMAPMTLAPDGRLLVGERAGGWVGGCSWTNPHHP